MQYRLLLLLFTLATKFTYAQTWTLVTGEIREMGQKDIVPDVDLKYSLDDAAMKALLWTAPNEHAVPVRKSPCVITAPLANGQFDQFAIVQYDMMESELAAKYKDIRTFYGFSVTNPYRKIRLDYTNYGFRAVIKDPDNPHTYIDHYQRNDREHKIVYYKKNLKNIHQWSCGFDEIEENQNHRPEESGNRAGDCVFRKYRLAQTATTEYSNFHGAFSSAQEVLVMSAVVLVVNRCNGVFEEDFTLRTVLVNNTDTLFFYDENSEPFSSNDVGVLLNENTTECNSRIGSGNYDIGHIYTKGTTNNGVAYLNALCNSSIKGGGATSQINPVGDPFAIDYVAHEMGHQLGGQHTQYNNCNRSNASAMEPGSASTIMGYAGICAPNVQNNSDDYFHARNIQQTSTLVTGTANCFTTIPFVNQPPVVNDVPNYTIPKSTPFVLTAVATDADNDPMTYCWEQMNAFTSPAQTMPPASTNTTGPVFRSLDDVVSPSRYFPSLDNIVNGTTDTWEVLPSVGRSLAFRITVRDYHTSAGCTDEDDVTVTVNGTAGPFLVTSFNTTATWTGNETKTITWDVAGTTANNVNCANVDIFLSTDGGYTYPITLATATPNDGTHDIIVPSNINTTQGRFMIRGSGNIFFDVNNANLTIAPNPSTFELSAFANTTTICNSDTFTATINVISIAGFVNPVTLSIPNAPPGSTVTFAANPVIPGNATLVKIFNLAPNTGSYNLTVNGVSGTINKQTNVIANLVGTLPAPNLLTPANNASGQSVIPTLTWSTVNGATKYNYQVSRSSSFSFISAQGEATNDVVKIKNGVEGSSQIFWRVKSINECAAQNVWSSTFSFNTESCFFDLAEGIPQIIPTSTATIISNNKCNYKGRTENTDVLQLEGEHDFIDDLKFSLISPDNVEVLFWDRPCNSEDDFNIGFSNTATSSNFPCPPTDSAVYIPGNTLMQNAKPFGIWKLKIEDVTSGNGGQLNRWAIKSCYSEICKLEVDHPYSSGIGSLVNALSCAESNDTIFISNALNGFQIDLGTNHLNIDKNLVIKTNGGTNVEVITTSTNPTLVVNPGINLVLEGVSLKGSNSTNAVIVNNGSLVLKNLDVIKNTSIPLQKNVVNNNQIKIEGACNLEE